MIEHRLRRHVDRYNFLEEHQEGFRSGRVTVRSLYRLHFEAEKLKNSHARALLNTDMEKAFDSVWTNGLLYILKGYRVSDNLLKLMETFFRNRKAFIQIDSFCSDEFDIQSGLPQGSVLSPILFILFIDDFLISPLTVFKYADNTSVLVHVDSPANLADQLRNLCSSIESWCFNWKMKVNGSKTEIMSLHTDEPMPSRIYLKGQLCKAKEFTKSLGLVIDRKLTYKNNLDNAINKRQKSCNSIQRKCSKRCGFTLNTPRLLFKTVIQPQLIYASPIWAHSQRFGHILKRNRIAF